MEARYYSFLKSIYLKSFYILNQKETEAKPLAFNNSMNVTEVISKISQTLRDYKYNDVSKQDYKHKVECYLLDTYTGCKYLITAEKDKYGLVVKDIFYKFKEPKFDGIKINKQPVASKPKKVENDIWYVDYYPTWDRDENGIYLHNDLQHAWCHASSKNEALNNFRKEVDDLGEIIRIYQKK